MAPVYLTLSPEPKQGTDQDSVRADKKWIIMSQFAWKRLITELVTKTWVAGFLPITWTSCSEQFCFEFFSLPASRKSLQLKNTLGKSSLQ